MTDMTNPTDTSGDIAIVGMAAHLPGAADIAAYWQNLRDGRSSIRRLSEDALIDAGEPAALIHHKNYVPFGAHLDGFDMFDGEFFGLSPKDSAIMDPQHRQFLETAWEALENAGHMPENFEGAIGVFAGCGMGSYFYFNVCSNPDLVQSTGMFLLRHTGNDKDFLSTRVSHFLDITGPSVNVQTACSTSLVAAHYACQALLNGECDMALAGGVTIEFPQGRGYLYKENEILSPDGECHAFDHRAQGTVFGSGAGTVVLRRLEDAIADGDHIWAVIKGSAVNNDGADKAGYLAPSVGGQAAAIAEAQAIAGVTADTIDYVECHGTGTYLGDPIEVAALTEAFRETTDEAQFCRIGSVKTNIGHLDTAAGVASLIKASLGLHHRQMPPSLGYEAPNPSIDFETSPFAVNAALTDWTSHKGPRRAGVNSLGVGGTNAHVVLEEAPERPASDQSDWPFQLITMSARSKAALKDVDATLTRYLRETDVDLADIAWTLKEGRRAFEKRRVVVAETAAEAADLLAKGDQRRVFTHTALPDPETVFMFPGGGAQFAGMARGLYETEPVFADWMDRGLDILQPKLDYDIRALWLPDSEAATQEADERLKTPSVQLPLIMITEYALAQLWISWGVTPAALVGHSMGENTAACLAGVMSFEDCIGLVHLRGTLFDTVPAGGMLSVNLPAGELQAYLGDDLDLASVNAPDLSVASGPDHLLDGLEKTLRAKDIDCQRIAIDIAAHSRMLEPILDRFRAYLQSIPLNPPQIPFVSNRSGAFITDDEATDPDYWVAHLRGTVHFADCITTLTAEPNRVFLEVGPGKALSSLTRQHGQVPGQQVLSSLRHPQDDTPDDIYHMTTLGRLWALGVDFDWGQIWGEARRNRVPLPTYPFQRQRYFIEPGKPQTALPDLLMRDGTVTDWGSTPAWKPALADTPFDIETGLDGIDPLTWLMFMDDAGLADRLARRLTEAGHTVVEVRAGDSFQRETDTSYVIAPERGRESYDLLIQDLVQRGMVPERIAHFWLATNARTFRPGSSFFHRNIEQGFYSLLFLAQAIEEEALPKPIHLTCVTTGAEQVRDEPLPCPENATAQGPLRVLPREAPGFTASSLDITLPDLPRKRRDRAAYDAALDALELPLLEELLARPSARVAALRGPRRFERVYRAADLGVMGGPQIADGATVMITGGFGGIGLTIAEDLIQRHDARIVLMSRSPLPGREDWADHLRGHGPQDPVSRRIRAIERLEAMGGEVLVCAADVSNIEDIRRARTEAEERFGPVSGLIHAAGVIDDGPLLAKSPAGIEEVFTPKIHGLHVIEEAFPDGSLDWMALFSSTSTVTAPAGQVDYVAANAFLNAYATSRRDDATRVVAINWGIWNEVGMAADAVATRTGTAPRAEPRPVTAPMLDTATFDADGHRQFDMTYDAARDWWVDEHRTGTGDALLAGTGYIELAAEALSAHGETGPFEIRDLTFLRPLHVPDGTPKEARLRLKRQKAGYGMDVQSPARLDGRTGWQTHAQATLALVPMAVPDPIDAGAILGRCPTREDGALRSPQEAHLKFGPRWRVITSTAYGTGEGIATLRLPDAAASDLTDGFLLHPALLDLATGWAMSLIDGYEASHLWVPVSYPQIRVFRPLPQDIVSWVRSAGDNSTDAPVAQFDVTIADTSGNVCVEVRGFTIKRIDSVAAFGQAPRLTPAELEFDADPANQPLSPAEERLAHNLSQGILPHEGAEAFRRALGTGLSQVIVSSLDLDALTEQTAATGITSDGDGQKFDRPELDSDYVAPETDIERTLVSFWEDLLGVSNVGVEDSFFDLGGHSLIAVRLFAMVKKAYRIEFPISVLFEAPTIRTCAALIAAQTGDTGTSATQAETGDEKPAQLARRYTHLVPMHDGEGGPKTPFFLVAGMFGNVLNLRHLANLIGADRPFFGLQARGLYGDEAPHRDLVTAAADYIAEMRTVQPEGPYLLGGFSGGGITALEIARQLEAAGETVSLLAMLDTPLPVRRPLKPVDRALIFAQDLRKGGLAHLLGWPLRRIRWEIAKRTGNVPDAAPDHGFHNAAIEAAFMDAVNQYHVRPWDGRLVLFRPPLVGKWTVSGGALVSSERAYLLDDNDWSQHIPDVTVFEVPGDHDSMVLEPNVRVLAARMKACIEEAEHSLQAEPLSPPKAAE
ncbi:type I polyketide synthase [Pseudaestuariivita atlantica]|uniref:Polyketide synthase n=1 Tax=Pseudaestuariivita atlantica TaxID=1317121 RepID=A0A0L1JQ69_9RHOB|nr:type I polyketide synthase [Pseudaestuariivita atlantica]KNG93886.1 polyketide synthase [Pseudaestuariivita atlantica]